MALSNRPSTTFLCTKCMLVTLIICDNKCNILQVFKGCHPAIKFTTEVETGETFSFLDVRLRKKTDRTLNSISKAYMEQPVNKTLQLSTHQSQVKPKNIPCD
uniref:Uncharacterized protein n=1 Tax=Trichobilharzia regenti TaxID=157069 RepID=A0AA85KFI0_TRIRE|nr:unnamed protein product [Trichobilharzia regenti]